ncbi:MAG: hypothetical protein WDO14_16685 [Bacteroidota bacterium]
MQFIVETGLIALFSVIVACVMSQLLLPLMNTLLQTKLVIHFVDQWQLPVFLASILLFVVNCIRSLSCYTDDAVRAGEDLETKAFVGQRIVVAARTDHHAVCSFAGPYYLYHHHSFADEVFDEHRLGFDKNAIVMVTIPNGDKVKMKTLRDRLIAMPGVRDVSLCFSAPGSGANVETSVRYDNHEKDEPWDINMKQADDQYVSTFNLKLVAGRNLMPSDSVTEFFGERNICEETRYRIASRCGWKDAEH